MEAVIGLFSKQEDAQKAFVDVEENHGEKKALLILEASDATSLNQVLANQPQRGAIWGALVGVVIGILVGFVIGIVVANASGASLQFYFPLLGAIFLGVIFAYLGALYTTRVLTAHVQAFKETLAEGGALVVIPAKGKKAQRLEAVLRNFGGQLVDTYRVHDNELQKLYQ